jgi:hypothetical protein
MSSTINVSVPVCAIDGCTQGYILVLNAILQFLLALVGLIAACHFIKCESDCCGKEVCGIRAVLDDDENKIKKSTNNNSSH